MRIQDAEQLDELQLVMVQILSELSEANESWKVQYRPGKDVIEIQTEAGTVATLGAQYDQDGKVEVQATITGRRNAITIGNLGLLSAAIKRMV